MSFRFSNKRTFISFLIALLLISLMTAYPMKARAKTIEKFSMKKYSVQRGRDDGFTYIYVEPGVPPKFTAYFFKDERYILMLSSSSTCYNWFRFQNVDLPEGARIFFARLIFTGFEASADSDVEYRVQGFDEDNATAPSWYEDFINRPKTSAYDKNTLPPFSKDVKQDVVVTETVREIMDRPGWVSGNSIVICSSAEANAFPKTCYSVEGTRLAEVWCPVLEIQYIWVLQYPIASFTYSPTSPIEGQAVSFDALGSTDSDGSIAAYLWEFGDGLTGTGKTITHTYESVNTFTVKLTVTDNDGLTNQTVKTITVSSLITDSDGDGVGDNADAFPNDPSEQADSDGDGVGDNADAFPNDPSRTRAAEPATQTGLKIFVKDTDGKPIIGSGLTSTSQPSGQPTLDGTTGSDGSVMFGDIKPGSYTFLASASGYESISESISASSGQINEKTILLEAQPSGIPGFSYEAIILGLTLGILLLWWLHRR